MRDLRDGTAQEHWGSRAPLVPQKTQSSESSQSSMGMPPRALCPTPDEMGQHVAEEERVFPQEGDRRLATPAIAATAAMQRSEPDEHSRDAPPRAPEAPSAYRVYVPPPEKDPAPRQYWSELVQADFWVCETASQAATLRTQGQVAYLPAEIGLLRELKARDPSTFAAKLLAIHPIKQIFGTVLDTLEQAAAPVFETVP